jgi:hypothetical protein
MPRLRELQKNRNLSMYDYEFIEKNIEGEI